jgi:hypothetical protein
MPVKKAEKKPKDFQAVYDELKKLMAPYAKGTLKANETAIDFQLIGPPVPRSRGKAVWFGAVRIGKAYVSYHLMPVYAFPDLLDGISPELKKRMQGKSCFNFTAIDRLLFKELKRLTKAGYDRFKQSELVQQ